MPFGIGIWELVILLLVMLLVFGPKRLPEMGRSLGRGLRELKDGIATHTEPLREAVSGNEVRVTVADVDEPYVAVDQRKFTDIHTNGLHSKEFEPNESRSSGTQSKQKEVSA